MACASVAVVTILEKYFMYLLHKIHILFIVVCFVNSPTVWVALLCLQKIRENVLFIILMSERGLKLGIFLLHLHI